MTHDESKQQKKTHFLCVCVLCRGPPTFSLAGADQSLWIWRMPRCSPNKRQANNINTTWASNGHYRIPCRLATCIARHLRGAKPWLHMPQMAPASNNRDDGHINKPKGKKRPVKHERAVYAALQELSCWDFGRKGQDRRFCCIQLLLAYVHCPGTNLPAVNIWQFLCTRLHLQLSWLSQWVLWGFWNQSVCFSDCKAGRY